MAETGQTSAQRRLRDRGKTSSPAVSLRLSNPKQGRGSGRGGGGRRGRGRGRGRGSGRLAEEEEKEKGDVEQPRPSAEDERIMAMVRAVKLELLEGKHRVIPCVNRPKHPEFDEEDEKEQPSSRLKSPQQSRKKKSNTSNFEMLKLGKKYRDWAALPPEALSIIFQKLGVVRVLAYTQSVCTKWRAVASTVTLRPFIDLRILPESTLSQIDPEKLAISAFHRTTLPIEELHVVSVGDDFLALVAHRTGSLRCFSLIETVEVSTKGLLSFLNCCPLLEELSICLCPNLHDSYPDVARACPGLKRLFVNGYIDDFSVDSDSDYRMVRKADKYDGMDDSDDPDDPDSDDDPEPGTYIDKPLSTGDRMAMEIAKCMPQLNGLQIVRDISLTNRGVHAILDNCLHLEYLDLRRCYYVRVDGALHTRLDKIKTVRLSRRSVLVLTKLLGKRPYV